MASGARKPTGSSRFLAPKLSNPQALRKGALILLHCFSIAAHARLVLPGAAHAFVFALVHSARTCPTYHPAEGVACACKTCAKVQVPRAQNASIFPHKTTQEKKGRRVERLECALAQQCFLSAKRRPYGFPFSLSFFLALRARNWATRDNPKLRLIWNQSVAVRPRNLLRETSLVQQFCSLSEHIYGIRNRCISNGFQDAICEERFYFLALVPHCNVRRLCYKMITSFKG